MNFKKFNNGSWSDTPVYKYCKTNGPNLVESNLTTISTQGVTIVNTNGVVTINGTTTIGTWIWVQSGTVSSQGTFQELGKGKYAIGGVPEDATVSTYRMHLLYRSTASGSQTSVQILPDNDPVIIDNTNGDYNYVALRITIASGTVCDNVVFTPYIKPIDNSWYQVEAYKRENGAWTASPTNGRRLSRKKKIVTVICDPEDS